MADDVQVLGIQVDSGESAKTLDDLASALEGTGKAAVGAAKPLDNYGKESKKAGKDTKNFSSSLKEAVPTLQSLQKEIVSSTAKMLGVGVAVGTVIRTIRSATEQYANFETQLAQIKTISGSTEAEMKRLKETAEDLGATTIFTSTDVAKGMVSLSRAGKDANTQIDLIKPAMDLATAGFVEMDTAAEALTINMKKFNLETYDTAETARLFITSANSAEQSMLQFLSAFSRSSGQVANLGKDIDDAAEIVTVVAGAGKTGEEAATGINAFIRSLEKLNKPSKEQSEVLKKIEGGFKSLNPVTNSFKDIVGALSDANLKSVESMSLFDEEARKVFTPVINQGTEAFDNFRKSLEGAPSAAQSAEGAIGNVERATKSMISAYEGASLVLGEVVSPTQIEALEGLQNIFTDIRLSVKDSAEELKLFAKIITGVAKIIVGAVDVVWEGFNVGWRSILTVVNESTAKITEFASTLFNFAASITGLDNIGFISDLGDFLESAAEGTRKLSDATVDGLADTIKNADGLLKIYEGFTGENILTRKEMERQKKLAEEQLEITNKDIKAEKEKRKAKQDAENKTSGGTGGTGINGSDISWEDVADAVTKLAVQSAVEVAETERVIRAKQEETDKIRNSIDIYGQAPKVIQKFFDSIKASNAELSAIQDTVNSGISSAGPNAARGMQAINAYKQAGGGVTGALNAVASLVLSNEKIQELIERFFTLVLDRFDAVIDPIADILGSFFDVIEALQPLSDIASGFEIAVRSMQKIAEVVGYIAEKLTGGIATAGEGLGDGITNLFGGNDGGVGDEIKGMFGGTTKAAQKKINNELKSSIGDFLDGVYAGLEDEATQRRVSLQRSFDDQIRNIKKSEAGKETKNELKEATRVANAAALAAEGFFEEAREMAIKAAEGGGASADAYEKAMKGVRNAQIKFGNELIEPAIELLETDGLSDFQKELRDVTKSYEEQRASLEGMDPDLKEHYSNLLDQAEAIERVNIAEKQRASVMDEVEAYLNTVGSSEAKAAIRDIREEEKAKIKDVKDSAIFINREQEQIDLLNIKREASIKIYEQEALALERRNKGLEASRDLALELEIANEEVQGRDVAAQFKKLALATSQGINSIYEELKTNAADALGLSDVNQQALFDSDSPVWDTLDDDKRKKWEDAVDAVNSKLSDWRTTLESIESQGKLEVLNNVTTAFNEFIDPMSDQDREIQQLSESIAKSQSDYIQALYAEHHDKTFLIGEREKAERELKNKELSIIDSAEKALTAGIQKIKDSYESLDNDKIQTAQEAFLNISKSFDESVLNEFEKSLQSVNERFNDLKDAAIAANNAAGGSTATGKTNSQIIAETDIVLQKARNEIIQQHIEEIEKETKEIQKQTQARQEARQEALDDVAFSIAFDQLSDVSKAIVEVAQKYEDLTNSYEFTTDEIVKLTEYQTQEIKAKLSTVFEPFFDQLNTVQQSIRDYRKDFIEVIPKDAVAIFNIIESLKKVDLAELTSDEDIQDYLDKVQDVFEGTKDLADLQKQSLDDQANAVQGLNNLSQQLNQTIRGIQFGEFNVDTVDQKFADAQKEFETLKKSALDAISTTDTADDAVIGEFEAFANTFLNIAQEAFKSGQQYKDIFTSVIDDLNSVDEAIDKDVSERKTKIEQQSGSDTGVISGLLDSIEGVSDKFADDLSNNINNLVDGSGSGQISDALGGLGPDFNLSNGGGNVTKEDISQIGTKIDQLIAVLQNKELNVEVNTDPSNLVKTEIKKSVDNLKKRLENDSETRPLAEKFISE